MAIFLILCFVKIFTVILLIDCLNYPTIKLHVAFSNDFTPREL